VVTISDIVRFKRLNSWPILTNIGTYTAYESCILEIKAVNIKDHAQKFYEK
jgi:hypothetical protein